ncbi:MAG: hypothetical protein IJ520_05070 [Synergistaceae bacterium]|nr:hypothetical protein [Synergistaceae bacterium]
MFAVLRGWLACFYNAALWSMLASVILFNNTWLEMRVNLGLIFFALTALIFIALRGLRLGKKFALLSLIFISLTCWLILGSDGIAIIPAAIIREGLGLALSLNYINYIIYAFLILGWIAL